MTEFDDNFVTNKYKIIIDDRNYTEWKLYESLHLNQVDKLPIDPCTEKLFSGDVFEYNTTTKTVDIIHSTLRSTVNIPGILVLKGGKTFGKATGKVSGKTNDKYLYKCIPDDKRIPVFTIPYALKIGFSKNIDNKYVVFQFDNWNGKHPEATLLNVLGDVDILANYYEYQLYCKSLYASIQTFNKATSDALKKKTEPEFINEMIEKYSLIDRTNEKIYSIDSHDTTDYDDAFSITEHTNPDSEYSGYKISIYIANVPMWMEELDIWNAFSERISTIYLPDRKRPMMPNPLSNCVCSLCEDVVRLAFALDITIINNEIVGYKFENTYIKVYKNHVYDSKELLADVNHQKMFDVVDKLSKVYKYTSKIKTSGDLVSYLMILMNYYTALEMTKHGNGIYRSVNFNKDVEKQAGLPEDVNNFLKIWNSSSGQYDLYNERKSHEMLELDAYIHCTSPIRRLVDLLNMARLQQNLSLNVYSTNFEAFEDRWIGKLEYINTTMRAIRKIQNDCNLLEMCTNKPEICEREHNGYIFDKLERSDGLFQYIVYLPELKIVSRLTIRNVFTDYSNYKFKIFVFHDESSLKKKIRIHLVE
jgi:exoribonuclease R